MTVKMFGLLLYGLFIFLFALFLLHLKKKLKAEDKAD